MPSFWPYIVGSLKYLLGRRPADGRGETLLTSYHCSACSRKFHGFPPAATPAGRPLCSKCKLKSLRKR